MSWISNHIFKWIYSVPEVLAESHTSRSRFYEDLRDGHVKSFKRGRRRFMTGENLKDYLEWLVETGQADVELPPKKQRQVGVDLQKHHAEGRAASD